MELPPATVHLPAGADPHSPEFLAAVSTASLGLLDALGLDALCGAEAVSGHVGGKRLPQYRVAPDGKLYTRGEFKRFFGGLAEWRAASPPPAVEPADPRADPCTPHGRGAGAGCRHGRGACDSPAARRWGGRCVVAGMLALIAFEEHAFLALGVPRLAASPGARCALCAASVCSALCVLYYYALVGLACPAPGEAADAAQLPAGWCDRCQAAKPPRCHHCSTCGRCVPKMDHHCVFVNGCVGAHNQHHFLKFLLSLVLGLCWPVLGLLPAVLQVVLGGDAPVARAPPASEQAQAVAAFVAGAVALWLLLGLLCFHLRLLLRNETTLESYRNFVERRRSPYDAGLLANFASVFGEPPGWLPRGALEACLRSLDWVLDGPVDG